MRKGFTFVAAAVVVAAIAGHAIKKPADAATEGQGVPVPKVEPVKVSAGQLFAAYHDNEVAADAI